MTSHSVRKPKSLNANEPDDVTDWETHTILRVPSKYVPLVNQFIEQGDQYDPTQPSNVQKGQIKLQVNFQNNMRTGELKIGPEKLNFVVQDLPTIVETYKTHDNVNVYKVSDISQVINCTVDEVPDLSVPIDGDKHDPEVAAAIEKNKKMLHCYHGLTPPMRNAHKRRFRKTKKMKYMDAPQVEQELKRLLRADLEALSVRWEIMDADPKPSAQKKQPEPTPGPSTS
uniref:TAFII55_N domain-containing protein n=1 Tax=Panagrellus redivivus TaxID=6233 RepID=A0A7E4VKD8_PANRE